MTAFAPPMSDFNTYKLNLWKAPSPRNAIRVTGHTPRVAARWDRYRGGDMVSPEGMLAPIELDSLRDL